MKSRVGSLGLSPSSTQMPTSARSAASLRFFLRCDHPLRYSPSTLKIGSTNIGDTTTIHTTVHA
jgi:hypothetical protein